MTDSFWQKRLSRRRLLTGAASLAVVGGGAGLFLPRRFTAPGSNASRSRFRSRLERFRSRFERLRHVRRRRHPPCSQPDGGRSASSAGLGESRRPADPASGRILRRASTPRLSSRRTLPRPTSESTGAPKAPSRPPSASSCAPPPTAADWSPWRATWLESEPSEDPRNGESFAALVWAGDARFVQYRATLPGRSDDAPALRYVVLTALSAAPPSAELAAAKTSKTKTPTAAATPRATGTPKPTATTNAGALDPPFAKGYLLSREDWGADESLRYDSSGQEVWPPMYVPTKKIIVHHTAGLDNSNPADPNYPYPSYTADQAVQEVRGVYYYHAITHGWGDIGYNALIDRFGRVFEGRRGRESGPHGGARDHQPRRRRRPCPQLQRGRHRRLPDRQLRRQPVGLDRASEPRAGAARLPYLVLPPLLHLAHRLLRLPRGRLGPGPRPVQHHRPPRRQPDRLPRPVRLPLPARLATAGRREGLAAHVRPALDADHQIPERRRRRRQLRLVHLEIERLRRRRSSPTISKAGSPTSTPTRNTTSAASPATSVPTGPTSPPTPPRSSPSPWPPATPSTCAPRTPRTTTRAPSTTTGPSSPRSPAPPSARSASPASSRTSRPLSSIPVVALCQVSFCPPLLVTTLTVDPWPHGLTIASEPPSR